jgi:hypothetical protein
MNTDTEQNSFVDPLDTNVNDINTKYPLIPAGTVTEMRIKDAKLDANKAGDGQNLVLAFETIKELMSTDNESIPPGLTISHYIPINPKHTEGKQPYTLDQIKKAIAMVAQSAHMNCSVKDIITNPAILTGKVVNVKVSISKETAEFAAANRLRFIVVR